MTREISRLCMLMSLSGFDMSFWFNDPERPNYLDHFTRELNALQDCRAVYTGSWDTKQLWREDVGYCLDRYSKIDCEARVYEF